MASYSISEIAALTGIKAHTIRIWEKRYNLPKPSRSDTNIRSYSDADLVQLLNIAVLQSQGSRISNLAKMTDSEIQTAVRELEVQEFNEPQIMNKLSQAMLQMDESAIKEILSKNIEDFSVSHCVQRVMFPFLKRLGVLWQIGEVTPVQEHFVSNIFRSKLMSEIDRIDDPPFRASCILFMPEGEYHELGLLFTYYLLKHKGFKVYYLGTSVPVDGVNKIVKRTDPAFLVSGICTGISKAESKEYWEQLEADCELYVASCSMEVAESDIPGVTTIIREHGELLEAVL